MIAEDLLERGLADVASDYDVPDGAVDRIRSQLVPMAEEESSTWRTRLHRPSPRGWLVLAAAALVIIVIASFAVGGGGDNSTHDALIGDSAGAANAGDTPILAAPSPAPQLAHKAARAPAYSAVTGSVAGGTAATPGGTTTGAGTNDSANSQLPPVPTAPDKVIKTGELDLQVPKGEVGHTLDQVTGIATLERGYIADSRTSEGTFAPSGQVTLRVPVGNFEDAIKRARAIEGVKVLSLQTTGKDVTSKYVDLKARISALKKTRETFLTLLAKANTIGETLAVQQHITDVQTQIEELQGQTNVLVNRAALSTLTITVDQKVAAVEAAPVHHKSGLHKAVDRSVSRFVHGIEAIIGIIGPVLLVLLIVGLGWAAARFGYRLLRRRMV